MAITILQVVDVAIRFVTPLLSLLGVFLAGRAALKRFYREKWWEKRLTSFNSQIEAAYLLHRSLKYLHDSYDYKENPNDYSGFILLKEDEEMNLHKQFIHSLAELEKFQYLGDLLTSKKSVELIRDGVGKVNNIKPFLIEKDGKLPEEKHLKEAMQASAVLLEGLVNEAKCELDLDDGKRLFPKSGQ